jgi:hypothetical protein
MRIIYMSFYSLFLSLLEICRMNQFVHAIHSPRRLTIIVFLFSTYIFYSISQGQT